MQSGNKRGWGRINKGSPGSPSLGSGRFSVCTSTTHPPNPRLGDSIFEIDTGMHLFYQGSVVGWRQPWGIPWGVLGTVGLSASTGAITATTDCVGMTTSFTAVPNRQYAAFCHLGFSDTVSTDRLQFLITDGSGNAYGQYVHVTNDANASQTAEINIQLPNLAAGAQTVKARARRVAGTGSFTILAASSTDFIGIWVEDIGPNGLPT